MKYEGITISDIHFGAFDAEEMRNELENGFIKYIYSLKKIDFIVITGDFFDHKTYINDMATYHACIFMSELVNLSKQHKCPIRIVYGTNSHEENQYKLFSMYENDSSIDFKVIYTAEEEELLRGLKVLYLPEEYVLDKKEFYKDFFSKENYYDYIFGHGVIQEVMTMVKRTGKESTKEVKKVPVFTTADLLSICKGQTYFGHYHVNTNLMDKIFYVGSYSRWIFGEDAPKGFYHIHYDDGEYSNSFIENPYAKKFVSFIYGYDSPVFLSEENLLKELDEKDTYAELMNIDHLGFVFNIPENHPNPESIIHILNERYRYKKSVKVEITNGYVEKRRIINKKRLNETIEEFPLIFDKSASLENKVFYFIKKRSEKEIPLENIKKYLYQEVTIM